MRPVPEYDPKSWLLKALRETGHAMEALIWNLGYDDVSRRTDPEEWSCTELVHHMAEMEQRYGERLDLMAYRDDPAIPAFDADTIDPPDEDTSAFEVVEDFTTRRSHTVHLLWSLGDEDWERRGVHPYLGPLTILQVAREMNEHDLAHLWQLRRLCDALEPASV
jgi:hypothetical protein